MKTLIFGALFAFTSIVSITTSKSFETAQNVTATPITTVPFTITKPGNYYLPADLTSTAPGVAITINANEVVLDLNGRSLVAGGVATSPNVGIGIAVLNHEDVIIQNGDINSFGAFGILLDATDKKKDHNQKNRVQKVNFNGNRTGVLIVSGSLDVVEDCDFDGGSVGIEDIASSGGDRFQRDNFENQQAVESSSIGVGILTSGGKGTLTEDCLFADDLDGLVLSTAQDKFRFCSFNSDNITHFGGTEELNGDL